MKHYVVEIWRTVTLTERVIFEVEAEDEADAHDKVEEVRDDLTSDDWHEEWRTESEGAVKLTEFKPARETSHETNV